MASILYELCLADVALNRSSFSRTSCSVALWMSNVLSFCSRSSRTAPMCDVGRIANTSKRLTAVVVASSSSIVVDACVVDGSTLSVDISTSFGGSSLVILLIGNGYGFTKPTPSCSNRCGSDEKPGFEKL